MKKIRIFYLCLFFAAAAIAAETADPNLITGTRLIRRQIQEEQIQPLYLSITEVTPVDLGALINELSELKIPVSDPQPPVPAKEEKKVKPAPAVQTKSEAASPIQITASEAIAEPEKKVPAPLDEIDKVQNVSNPLTLADTLFKLNRLNQAEKFYEAALTSCKSPDEADWQWAVYQQANCCRKNNPQKAMQLYQKLISEAPNSRWSSAAGVQRDTLTWYQNADPEKLERMISDPNSI